MPLGLILNQKHEGVTPNIKNQSYGQNNKQNRTQK